MKFKRVISTILVFATLILGTASTVGSANSVEVETKDTPQASGAAAEKESSKDTADTLKNRLCDNIEDGVILHAWCWSFNTIKDNMEDIAAAGYTAVQTSPPNKCAGEGTALKLMGSSSDGSDGAWWWQYQPTEWSVGNYQLGTETQYKEMCTEAHKYGIKIIADIQPNHTTSDKSKVTSAFINSVSSNGNIDDLYHKEGLELGNIYNYDNRKQCTLRNMGGLPDVNTEDPYFQAYFIKYCNQLIDDGCDGFRIDTAKHIGVDSDPVDAYNANGKNDLFDVLTGQKSVTGKDGKTVKLKNRENLYFYGEVLQGGDEIPYKEYSKYMDLTASNYGINIRSQLNSNTLTASVMSDFSHKLSGDKLVTWVESHDTYCNNNESAWIPDSKIILGWAAIAARKEGTPLFFSRPAGRDINGSIWGNNEIGAAGDDNYKCAAVKAVNQFRNAVAGEAEAISNVNGNQVLKIDRGTKGSSGNKGTCIINIGSSSCSLNGVSTTLEDGTYTDRVDGTTQFEVSNGVFTSGSVQGGSVVVLYDTAGLKATPYKDTFTSDSIDVTLSYETIKSDTQATYTIAADGTEKSGTFTNGQNIKLGTGIDYNKEITLTLNATDSTGISLTREYKYYKQAESDVKYIYFDNNKYNWSAVNAYLYTTDTVYSSWPGEAMTYDESTGYYKYRVPHGYENGCVTFYSNDKTQYPPSEINIFIKNTDKILKYGNNWIDYNSNITPDVPNTPENRNPDTYVYFFDSMGWTDYEINVYMWNSSTGKNDSEWPGKMMSWSKDLHCYYYAYDSSFGFDKVIFSAQSKSAVNQTGDLDLTAGKVYVPTESYTNSDNEVRFRCTPITPNDIQSHKIYFKNTNNRDDVNAYLWRGGLKNVSWPGVEMKNLGNNQYSCTYYYPKLTNDENEDFEKIIFSNFGKNQTGDLTVPTDKKNHIYNNSWSDITSKKSTIPINFCYTNHRVADTNSSGTETYKEQQCITTVNADTSGKDLDSAIAAAIVSTKDSNLYDTYNCYVSQFDYVKSLASTPDSRLGSSTTTYGAIYNPSMLAHSSNAFSGIYNNSIGTFDSTVLSNPKWVTYYGSNGKEIAYENILPDLSNLDHVDIQVLSMPKSHGVTFCYPNADTTLTSFNNGNLYVAKDNSDSNTKVTKTSYKRNYNDIYSENADDYAELTNGMYIPTVDSDKCVFDGWYIIEFDSNNNVKSYVKVSSELEYKYRLTSNLKLYAVFTKAESTLKGASVPKSDVDVFTDNNSDTIKYRFNTMLNVYNTSDYDEEDQNRITDVAVIYVRLGANDTYNLNTVRSSLKNNFSSTGSVKTNNGTAEYISYEVGSQVQLTSKNRLQFILTLTESQVTSGDYQNVLAFTAFKTGNTWTISDNCINYKNGEANLVMLTN